MEKTTGQIFKAKNSKCHNSVKNHGTTTGVQHAQLGMLIYNPRKVSSKSDRGVMEKTTGQIFKAKISKCNNSCKKSWNRNRSTACTTRHADIQS